MIVGKSPNHSDHDQALTTLLETARRCNVQVNYEKLQYKKQEVEFFQVVGRLSGTEHWLLKTSFHLATAGLHQV